MLQGRRQRIGERNIGNQSLGAATLMQWARPVVRRRFVFSSATRTPTLVRPSQMAR